MIPSAFLVVALALPIEPPLKRWEQLRDFLLAHHPNYEFIISNSDFPREGIGWIKLPFRWNGYSIFERKLKRAA